MTIKELIQYCENRIKYLESFAKAYAGIINPLRNEEEANAHKEIIAALSRTIIRQTATEPPTEKDGDKFGSVLAKKSHFEKWETVHYKDVIADQTIYTLWTCLPDTKESASACFQKEQQEKGENNVKL